MKSCCCLDTLLETKDFVWWGLGIHKAQLEMLQLLGKVMSCQKKTSGTRCRRSFAQCEKVIKEQICKILKNDY